MPFPQTQVRDFVLREKSTTSCLSGSVATLVLAYSCQERCSAPES